MGELDLNEDAYKNLLKVKAFDGWPGTYFFSVVNGKKRRVKITDAILDENGNFKILTVVPEGKKEMPYLDFIRN